MDCTSILGRKEDDDLICLKPGTKSSINFISENNDVNPATSCYLPFSDILKFQYEEA